MPDGRAKSLELDSVIFSASGSRLPYPAATNRGPDPDAPSSRLPAQRRLLTVSQSRTRSSAVLDSCPRHRSLPPLLATSRYVLPPPLFVNDLPNNDPYLAATCIPTDLARRSTTLPVSTSPLPLSLEYAHIRQSSSTRRCPCDLIRPSALFTAPADPARTTASLVHPEPPVSFSVLSFVSHLRPLISVRSFLLFFTYRGMHRACSMDVPPVPHP